jgi:hypothetical protein
MKRYELTRGPAMLTLAAGWSLVLSLLVSLPVTGFRTSTVGYVALIVGGLTILLRERVLVPVRVPVAAQSQAVAAPADRWGTHFPQG